MPRPVVSREEYRERMRHGKEAAKAAREAAATAPLTETQEFKEAVAKAATEAAEAATREILAKLANARPESRVSAGDRDWAEHLAMSIAELTDQGSGMKRVPPEIMLAREAAAKRMRDLLVEARAAEEAPTYRLLSKVVLPLNGSGETLIDPLWRGADNRVYPTEITWYDAPNLAMEPINERAITIMAAFKESIGNQVPSQVGVTLDYALSPQGHSVSGAVAGIIRSHDRDQGEPAVFAERPNMAVSAGAMLVQQGMTPPYRDVQVLGRTVPPARQNG